MLNQEQLVRNISVMANGEVDFFLGAGASIASGIPTGGDLIWQFKRLLYCMDHGIAIEKYKDLTLASTKNLFQQYFDQKEGYPHQGDGNEYSFYFEKCYADPMARKRFIESIVSGREPSLGYLCLAEMIFNGKVKNVWTTNFDPLVETSIHALHPINDILVYSSVNKQSSQIMNPTYPVIGKLHGDYRYDWLQNTEPELQSLENEIKEYAARQLSGKQLVVIGYSGSDESVMSFLENSVEVPGFLDKGLLWTVRKESVPNQRICDLIERMTQFGKPASIVEIEGFETLMVSLYQALGYDNATINQKKKGLVSKRDLSFGGRPVDCFIKLNTYLADRLPLCNVFETDISSWKELRKITDNTEIIAALYNKHIYSFSTKEELKAVFGSHMVSEVSYEEISEHILQKEDSIYIGLLYKLIERKMVASGIYPYQKEKYYNPKSMQLQNGNKVYDALEISLSYNSENIYLHLLPTFHATGKDGAKLSKEVYQFAINRNTSVLYNRQYNEKLRFWETLLRTGSKFIFSNDKFQLSFITPAISCGGQCRDKKWPEFSAYVYQEPLMCFSDKNAERKTINQLKGLAAYGPLDCSYIPNGATRPSVRLAVLAPKQDMTKILDHLGSLNTVQANTGKDDYLPNYEGFEKVYKRALLVPRQPDKCLCIGYDGRDVATYTPKKFVEFLKRAVEYYSKQIFDFEVLVIYIPKYFAHFRTSTSISTDFNLHDSIKLYAAEKGVTIQFVEEKSINTYDPCKVLWGLSTSLFTKSSGVLWHPESIQEGTAYIGISYAYSEEKGICIGCSQLFDSTGTGIRMVLRKIADPLFRGRKNPYMREDDARRMMTELREQYYRSNPTAKLDRIVIYKTTPFIREEISGIMQAFEGVSDIEMIQIQEYSSWRGIRFGAQPSQSAEGYAVKRGLTIPLDRDRFLLWTHGCVIHPELSGRKNYYKGSRGIPAPLLVKRFAGNSAGDVLAKEILMLTKMNWNSGDSMYKMLPVTLDFAKVLARMSKQDEAIYDKAYDFRFFM